MSSIRKVLVLLVLLALIIPSAGYVAGGISMPSHANASDAVSVSSVSINLPCTSTTATGVITLSGPFTGTVTLVGQSHLPGTGDFTSTGGSTTVSFSGTSSSTYSLTLNTVAGANAYRIAVHSSSPLIPGASRVDAQNTKSNSFECSFAPTVTPTATETTVPTETATATPTETVVVTPTETATVTPTETETSVPTATNTPVVPTATSTGTSAPTASVTSAPTNTSTAVPSATSTATTLVVATATNTPAATETNTAVPATSTPTATNTAVAPTATSTEVPTATNTPLTGAAPAPPTRTATPRPTNTARPTATRTPTARPTNTATPRPTNTAAPRPTMSAGGPAPCTQTCVAPTATPCGCATPTPTPTVCNTPTQTPQNTGGSAPTATATPRATSTTRPTATATATASPTATPRPVTRHPSTGRAEALTRPGFAPVTAASYANPATYANMRIAGRTYAMKPAAYPTILLQNVFTVDSDYQNLGRSGLTYAFAHDDLGAGVGTSLYNLHRGDVIFVQRGSHHYRYVVTSNVTVAPTNVAALTRHYSRSTLVLVTCTPVGVDTSRVVVTAQLR